MKGSLLKEEDIRRLWAIKDVIKVHRGTDEQPYFEIDGGLNRSPAYFNITGLWRYSRVTTDFIGNLATEAEIAGATEDVTAMVSDSESGIVFARELGRVFSRKSCSILKKGDTYGVRPSNVEIEGRKVLLVDSAAGQGRTLLKNVKLIKALGAVIEDALVAYDWQHGAEELLEGEGVKLHSYLTAGEVFDSSYDFHLMRGDVDQLAMMEVGKYIRDPEDWHKSKGFKYHSV